MDTGNHWKDNGEDFFLPVKVVSRLFRGKYLAELKQLWEEEKLEFYGTAGPYKNHYAFKELLDSCYRKEWTLYCKKPFHGAESVIQYLGKYTHRIAISNYRIKNMTKDMVTFTAKDYKNQGKWSFLWRLVSDTENLESASNSYCCVSAHSILCRKVGEIERPYTTATRTRFVQPGKIETDANERAVIGKAETAFSFAPPSILSLTVTV